MFAYPSFADLNGEEISGLDYRIQLRHGRSGVAVMAIHGGDIEPGTTEIADALAGDVHSFYSFSGLRPSGNARLHISSLTFDEPAGCEIAAQASVVVTIHGCKNKDAMTYVGGRHAKLKRAIKHALAAADFPVVDAKRLPGVNPHNICNRNQAGMGLQLEVSLGMRQGLFAGLSRPQRTRVSPYFSAYVLALRNGIDNVFSR